MRRFQFRLRLILALLGLWAGVANGAYRDIIQADSPIYYWPMDESSGTSLAATVGGTAITLTNGPLVAQTGQVDGTAVAFDGSARFICVGSPTGSSGATFDGGT